eukprot:12421603-Karenia_brevis.AAC.1
MSSKTWLHPRCTPVAPPLHPSVAPPPPGFCAALHLLGCPKLKHFERTKCGEHFHCTVDCHCHPPFHPSPSVFVTRCSKSGKIKREANFLPV